eukprot:258421-Rhodomonas_salina.1
MIGLWQHIFGTSFNGAVWVGVYGDGFDNDAAAIAKKWSRGDGTEFLVVPEEWRRLQYEAGTCATLGKFDGSLKLAGTRCDPKIKNKDNIPVQ